MANAAWGPSKIVVVKDCSGAKSACPSCHVQFRVTEIQLPWEAIAEAMHGPMGENVVVDVSHLLADLDRLRAMIVAIKETYTVVNGTQLCVTTD